MSSKKKRANGLKKSSSCQLLERKWQEQHPKRWLSNVKPEKNSRSRSCSSLISPRSSRRQSSGSTHSSPFMKKSRTRGTNTSLRFKTQVKTWPRWKKGSKSCKTKLKFWGMSHLKKTAYWLSAKSKLLLKSKTVTLWDLNSTKKNSLIKTKWVWLVRKLMKEIN